MSAKIIQGRAIAQEILGQLKTAIQALKGRPPSLVVVLVGNHPASEAYIAAKKRACDAVGIHSEVRHFSTTISQAELLFEIDRLNKDPAVDGFLIQLPLPPHISTRHVILKMDPAKDVDGFHPLNLGKLLIGDEQAIIPCTPYGILELLVRSEVQLSNKHVVIVGRSNIVGKPLAALLVQKRFECNATVTLIHSHTPHPAQICKEADVLIAAIGHPKTITAQMVKPGAIVIDVGINRIPAPETKHGYAIVGDVDFERVKEVCSMITPVPGGVGPMTVAMLLKNTWSCFLNHSSSCASSF